MSTASQPVYEWKAQDWRKAEQQVFKLAIRVSIELHNVAMSKPSTHCNDCLPLPGQRDCSPPGE
jgi:hypothetical protein